MSLSTNFNAVNNQIDDISFGILRTNPKLTTNVKLVVNSKGSLYMDSIESNNALSNTSFKKVPINPSGSYSLDISRFYNELPVNLRYDILRQDSDLSVFADYAKQYENQYQYGASFNAVKLYDEQYKFFAPIWLDKKIPSKFVIYRVEGTDYDSLFDNTLGDQNKRIMSLLNKATIIKTFDLSESSNIGQYLRNHVNASNFPFAPIAQNFEISEYTTYFGIDVVKGGFTQKREYTNADLIVDKIEIFNNRILTEGFERNELAIANLINLEFLFDDANATNYKIYRYFGLYVDDIEEGYFEVNDIVNNDATENLIIKSGSITTNYNLPSNLTHVNLFVNQSDLQYPSLNWIKSTNDNFFHIKNGINFDNTKNLPISLNGANIEEFINDSKVGTLKLEILSKEAKDFIKFKVNQTPQHGDKFYLTAVSELKASKYSLTPFTYMADSTLPAGKFDDQRYSSQGSIKNILNAIAACITYSDNPFVAKVVEETIVIEDYAQGYRRNTVSFGINVNNIETDFIEIISGFQSDLGLNNSILPSGSLTDFTDWYKWTMSGGKDQGRFIYIEKIQLGNLVVGHFIQDPVFNTKSEVLEILEDAFDSNFYRICLSKKIANLEKYNSLNYYKKPLTKFGKFSAYALKDFDFDFYDTSYSEYKELKLDDLIVASSAIKTHYKYYDLACSPSSDANDISSSNFNLSHDEYYPSLSYVSETDIVNRLDSVNNDFTKNANLKIKDFKIYTEYDRLHENELKETAVLSRVVPFINKFQLKDSFNARMKPYAFTLSEAFGRDNMSPNIDSGLQRNPIDYNMEHFHINQIPTEFKSSNYLSELRSYVDYLSLGELSLSNLKRTDVDYFSKYLIWDGAYIDIARVVEVIDNTSTSGITVVKFDKPINPAIINYTNSTITKKNGRILPIPPAGLGQGGLVLNLLGSMPIVTGVPGIQVGDIFEIDPGSAQSNRPDSRYFIKNKTRKLYTKFDKGDSSKFSNTIFRGLKYIYKTRKENINNQPTEFIHDNLANDYKFASILNVEKDATESSYEINVVKNDKFKFICIYINLKLQENNVIEVSHKLLYELRHAYINTNLVNTSIYGALDLNAAYNSSILPATINDSVEIIVNGLDDINGNAPRFEKQISLTSKGAYSYLVFRYNSIDYALQVSRVLSDNSVAILGYPKFWNGTFAGADAPIIASINPADQANLTYSYYGGGFDAFREVLDSIKAKSFSEIFNNFTEKINYINVKDDNSVVNDNFVLEIENGTPFYKESYIKAAVDEDKPKSYKISSVEVGKKIVLREDPYKTTIRRHNGYYVPSTRDVIHFTDLYTEYKALKNNVKTREELIYNRFNHTGIAFASYVDTSGETSFGLIKNYFYHKVNPEAPDSTLKLSSGTDKLPLYPKIGEIAIDKKDLNILESKYSEKYFSKSAPNNAVSFSPGTLSPIEKSAFMASTVMKVNDYYEISSFKDIKLSSLDELNTYRDNNTSTYSLAWTETGDKIYADFYIKKSILDELLEGGIKSLFDTYVTPSKSYGDLTTTLDDLQQYSEYNIAPRFIIDDILIFAKEGKNLNTAFINQIDPNLIDTDIYAPQTNYATEGFVQDRLSFRLIYNKKPSHNYEFKVVVKIIA